MSVSNVQILHKRGNTTVSSTYTGPVGEITIDTTLDTIRIHDGSTPGGFLLISSAQMLGNITAANLGMKGYVDSKIASNIAALIDSAPGVLDTLNELAAAINDDASFASNIINSINSTNSNITIANILVKGYVDGQILAANAGVTAANLGMKGYVDSVASQSIYGNVNVKAYTETMGFQNFGNVNVAAYVTSANSAIIGYIDQANTIQSAQIGAANLGMKGYVDNAVSTANIGIVGYIDQANTIQANQIAAANVGIIGYIDAQDIAGNTYASSLVTTANLGMKGYVDNLTYSNVQVEAFASLSTYAYNANVTAANLGMKGYVDNQITTIVGGAPAILDTLGELANALGADANLSVTITSQIANVNANITTANLGMVGYVDNKVSTANIGIIGYIDLANTIQSSQVGAAISAITAANLGMKGYVDSVASQSIYGNANVASYLHANDYSPYSNVNVAVFTNLSTYAYSANVTAANLGMKGYVDSVASQSIYGNSNVKSYLTQFDGNIVPSANVTYSLGSDTNRWKDLYLSGNTIFLGDTTISTSGGAVLTPVTRELFLQSFLPGSTNSAATFTLDRLPTAGSTRTVIVIGEQGAGIPPSPAPSYTLTEGVNFTISGLSLIITASYTATNIRCEESYSDTGDLITATTIATDTISPTSGDLTVSGNITVDGDLYVSPTSIYMGNLRISAADGNLKVNTGIKFSDDSVQSTAYSNVQVAAYLTANPPAGTYSNVQVGVFTNLSNYAYNANVTAANLGMKGYVDSLVGGGSSYGNSNVASYLISTQVSVANILLAPSGNIVFADGTVQTTAATGANSSNVNSVNGGYTDNSIIRYDGTSGNNIQNSLVTISDAGAITAASNTSSMIPFYYANVASFPDANTSHGALAHAHATGKMYYAHGGVWIEMANLSEVTAGSNYSNVNVKAYTESMGFQNYSNVNVAALITTNGLTNYSNVNVQAYTETMGFTNYSNVNVAAVITTNGLTNYSNVNVKAYTESMGFQNFSNVNVAAYVTTANSAVIGYVDNAVSTANVGIIGYIDRGNTIVTAGITTANVGMKGYVDNRSLDNLSDVVISSPTVGDILYYNGTNWEKQNGPTIRWSLSASGSNDYVYTGPGFYASTNDPLLYLHRGTTYIFVNTVHGSHPLEIRVSNGGAAYTNGVSGAGTATITFTVPMDAPSTLYYQCTAHSIMGNTINVVT